MFARRLLILLAILPAIFFGACQKSDDWVKKEEFYADGTLKSTANIKVVNGKELYVGEARTFYPSGKLHTVTEFVNGKRHGPHIEYDEDGSVKVRGEYAFGRQHGTWTETDKETGQTTTTKFDNGKRLG